MRPKSKKTLGEYSPEELCEASFQDLVIGRINFERENSNEILVRAKMPKWVLDNVGNLYLIIGEIAEYNSFISIAFPGQKTSSYGFLFIDRTPKQNRFEVPAVGWLTIPANVGRLGIEKKLTAMGQFIKKKNLIGEALWHFKSALPGKGEMKLYKMYVRGLITSGARAQFAELYKRGEE